MRVQFFFFSAVLAVTSAWYWRRDSVFQDEARYQRPAGLNDCKCRGYVLPNPDDCSSYFRCRGWNGAKDLFQCPKGLYFNSRTRRCGYSKGDCPLSNNDQQKEETPAAQQISPYPVGLGTTNSPAANEKIPESRQIQNGTNGDLDFWLDTSVFDKLADRPSDFLRYNPSPKGPILKSSPVDVYSLSNYVEDEYIQVSRPVYF